MKQKFLSFDQLQPQINLIVGKTVERMWNAYGFILYLELGKLQSVESVTPAGKKYVSEQGEWTLILEGEWKFWEKGQIIASSQKEDRVTLDPKIEKLSSKKMAIHSFTFNNETHSWLITFSNKLILQVNQIKNEEDPQLWSLNKRGTKTWFVVSEKGFEYQGSEK